MAALEARLVDIEGSYGETIYKLHRMSIKEGDHRGDRVWATQKVTAGVPQL